MRIGPGWNQSRRLSRKTRRRPVKKGFRSSSDSRTRLLQVKWCLRLNHSSESLNIAYKGYTCSDQSSFPVGLLKNGCAILRDKHAIENLVLRESLAKVFLLRNKMLSCWHVRMLSRHFTLHISHISKHNKCVNRPSPDLPQSSSIQVDPLYRLKRPRVFQRM